MSHASANSLPAAARAALDWRDPDEAACAQMAKQEGELRRLRTLLSDPGHVDL